MLFLLATTGAIQSFPAIACSAGALMGSLQNLRAGVSAVNTGLIEDSRAFIQTTQHIVFL